MPLTQLPSEILHEILLHAVRDLGLTHSLRLQLVNKRFAVEIPQAIYASGIADTCTKWACDTPFWQCYLTQRALTEKKVRGRITKFAEIRYIAEAVLRGEIISENRDERAKKLKDYVYQLCGLVLRQEQYHSYYQLFEERTPRVIDPDPSDLQVLVAAAYLGSEMTVQKILAKNPKIAGSHCYLTFGTYGPHSAGLNGHTEIVKIFLKIAVGPPEDGILEYALYGAAEGGHIDTIRVVLEALYHYKHPHVSNTDEYRTDLLSKAITIGTTDLAVLKLLLEARNKYSRSKPSFNIHLNTTLNRALHHAAVNNNIPSLHHVFSLSFTLDPNSLRGALNTVAKSGLPVPTHLLCTALARRTSRRALALDIAQADSLSGAVARGHFTTTQILLSHMARFRNARMHSAALDPLVKAVQADHKPLYALLRTHNIIFASIEAAEIALLRAVCRGDADWVRLILKHGVMPCHYSFDAVRDLRSYSDNKTFNEKFDEIERLLEVAKRKAMSGTWLRKRDSAMDAEMEIKAREVEQKKGKRLLMFGTGKEPDDGKIALEDDELWELRGQYWSRNSDGWRESLCGWVEKVKDLVLPSRARRDLRDYY